VSPCIIASACLCLAVLALVSALGVRLRVGFSSVSAVSVLVFLFLAGFSSGATVSALGDRFFAGFSSVTAFSLSRCFCLANP
jgi:hypothetical protein